MLDRSRGYGPRQWRVDRPRPGQHCRSCGLAAWARMAVGAWLVVRRIDGLAASSAIGTRSIPTDGVAIPRMKTKSLAIPIRGIAMPSVGIRSQLGEIRVD